MFVGHPEEGLRKLIFSDEVADKVGARMMLVEDLQTLRKSASTIFEGMSYDQLKPDKDHIGIHVVALGDFEHYGMNRNGDGFPKKACVERHHTFVDHGAVFIGHNNRDRAEAVGRIVKSAYNEPMGRIELFLHVHKQKAQPELHKLATDGESAYSMACRVPFDRCTVPGCGQLRKSAADPNQCWHVRDHLGETWADGTVVATQNDIHTWFDMSFVKRPADRIAWNLKVAMHGVLDSVKQAEAHDLWVPDSLECAIPGYQRKLELLKKLAQWEARYMQLATTKTAASIDRYHLALAKAAYSNVDDATIDEFRKAIPEDALREFAQRGVVLSAPAFFKFALGMQYGELADEMPAILRDASTAVCSKLLKQGNYQHVCRNTYFDVRDAYHVAWTGGADLRKVASDTIARSFSVLDPFTGQRVIDATIVGVQPTFGAMSLDKNAGAYGTVHHGAEIYTAYKLSALDAVLKLHKQANEDKLLALAAVQNLVR